MVQMIKQPTVLLEMTRRVNFTLNASLISSFSDSHSKVHCNGTQISSAWEEKLPKENTKLWFQAVSHYHQQSISFIKL